MFVDPEIAAGLAELPPFVFDAETLPVIRTLIPGAQTASADIDRADFVVGDAAPVELTVYRPRATAGELPCIYWMHGGGYVSGNRHMDDAQLEAWCRDLGCVCVTVEYRLAPEHPYPAGLDDCAAGFLWLATHAKELDIDPGKIGVGGRSAGGGLAAALALRTSEHGERRPRFLLLQYPMLDDRQVTPSSQMDDLPIWSRESNAFGWRSYLGERVQSAAVPELAAPARAPTVGALPPTCVIVGGIDGFRDEDIDFAHRLMRSGVPTELHVYAGAPHGFDQVFATAAVTHRASRDVQDWLRAVIA